MGCSWKEYVQHPAPSTPDIIIPCNNDYHKIHRAHLASLCIKMRDQIFRLHLCVLRVFVAINFEWVVGTTVWYQTTQLKKKISLLFSAKTYVSRSLISTWRTDDYSNLIKYSYIRRTLWSAAWSISVSPCISIIRKTLSDNVEETRYRLYRTFMQIFQHVVLTSYRQFTVWIEPMYS